MIIPLCDSHIVKAEESSFTVSKITIFLKMFFFQTNAKTIFKLKILYENIFLFKIVRAIEKNGKNAMKTNILVRKT